MTVKISGNSSASTPSFAGDDGDSGLHATADQVQLVTNGTVGVTVDSSQNVGIGTTTPGTKLEVGGAITSKTSTAGLNNQSITFSESGSGNGYGVRLGHVSNTEFAFERYDGGWVETVRIDGAGRVGIGADPSSKLHLSAASGSVQMQINSGGNPTYIGHDSGFTGLDFAAGGGIRFRYHTGAAYATAATIDTSGRVLVGTTSNIDANSKLQIESDANDKIVLKATSAVANNGSQINWYVGNTHKAAIFGGNDASSDAFLKFSTTSSGGSSPTERMRIEARGIVYGYSTDAGYIQGLSNGAGTIFRFFSGRHSATGANGTGSESYRVWSNGNVQNTNNSYGSISDIKLKENIVDASSQWDDLKAIQVRKYNFKEETGHETFTQLGVIAQELETVCPGLVDETPDFDDDGNDLGTTTKSVNYSVLYMKAVKALQEAMGRIETLETVNAEQATTIASFEARISALEGGN